MPHPPPVVRVAAGGRASRSATRLIGRAVAHRHRANILIAARSVRALGGPRRALQGRSLRSLLRSLVVSVQIPSQHWLPGRQGSQIRGRDRDADAVLARAPVRAHDAAATAVAVVVRRVGAAERAARLERGTAEGSAGLARGLAATVHAKRRGGRANDAAGAAVVRVGLDARRTVRVAPGVIDHALPYLRVAARPGGTVRVRVARRADPDPELALKGRPRAAGEEREEKKNDGERQTACSNHLKVHSWMQALQVRSVHSRYALSTAVPVKRRRISGAPRGSIDGEELLPHVKDGRCRTDSAPGSRPDRRRTHGRPHERGFPIWPSGFGGRRTSPRTTSLSPTRTVAPTNVGASRYRS